MRASLSFLSTLLLAVIFATLHSRELTTHATSCEACEAWEALEDVYNSTGNLTDIGYNRTAGGGASDGSRRGGMNHTTSRNASIPMPNGTMVPSPTRNPPPQSASPVMSKITAATLASIVVLLTA